MTQASQHKGFSLIELSIVLVILGLLVGGILAGQSLIRASELRSLGADVTKYTTATFTFKDKYFGLPGDITNATGFWGLAGGTTGDSSDTTCQQQLSSTGTATCNGDGNGQIIGYERFRYWQQLANASLIEGQYTGRGIVYASSPQYGCRVGQNCPAMRMQNTTASPQFNGIPSDDGNSLPYPWANYFFVGKTSLTNGTTNDNPLGAIISTEEAWNIDTKLDDGKPYTGNVQTHFRKNAVAAWAQDVNNCAASTAVTSDYDLSRTGLSCAFRIMLSKP